MASKRLPPSRAAAPGCACKPPPALSDDAVRPALRRRAVAHSCRVVDPLPQAFRQVCQVVVAASRPGNVTNRRGAAICGAAPRPYRDTSAL